jgi:hypothetical protein
MEGGGGGGIDTTIGHIHIVIDCPQNLLLYFVSRSCEVYLGYDLYTQNKM